jgi:hypothetical protein
MTQSNQTRSRFPIWLAVVAVLAIVVVVGLLFLAVVAPNASAAKDLRAALQTTRGYKGWIHVRATPPQTQFNLPSGVVPPTATSATAQPGGTGADLNTVNGTWVRGSDVKGTRHIEMHEPARRTSYEYDAGANELRVSEGAEATTGAFVDEIAGSPVTLDDLLARYDAASKAPPSTDASRDGDLTRYDLVGRGDSRAFKGSIWVDPSTKLIRKARWDTPDGPVDVTYTYGAPDIPDIHAAGVPRDAAVIKQPATQSSVRANRAP